MHLNFNQSLALRYKSNSQRVRVLSEHWAASECYCLNCDSDSIEQTATNTQARDFVCQKCAHPYELKSGLGKLGRSIRDGAYESMMNRITRSETPSFLFLRYDLAWRITSLVAAHRYFITADIIHKANTLGDGAVRRGWVGCHILVGDIPIEGKIALVERGAIREKSEVRAKFQMADALELLTPLDRGWTSLMLRFLHQLGRDEFELAHAYALETRLKHFYPNNRHIPAKIRQQLQILRDLGFIEFEGRGRYRFVVT